MNKSALWICIVVGVLGLIAFVLGIAAEATHNKAEIERDESGRCKYRRNTAFALGEIAALALLMAQIIMNVAACCLCCRRRVHDRAPCKTTIAIIGVIISWVTFLIGFSILVVGASLNNQHGEGYFSTHCYVVKTGAFTGGAVLSLATVTLGIISYLIASAVKSSAPWSHQNHDIAMTQPQAVPLNPQPVFVPANEYNR